MKTTFSSEIEKLAARKKAAAPGTAKQVLQEPGACALALLVAAKDVAGPDWHDWEPETQWMTLAWHGIDVPGENRAKIQAAIALRCVPAFYWDGLVLEKTALAFDGREVNADVLEEATTAQLAWAVSEAAQIVTYFGDLPWNFDLEPMAYAATVMHREGLVVAPERLQFAQEQLDAMNCKEAPTGEEGAAEPFKKQVEKAWVALDKKTLATHTFPEDRLGVQLAHLAAVELHLQTRESRGAADLTTLRA